MEQITGTKFIINNTVADVSRFIPETSATLYYEVIRIIDGKYIFLEDHLDRLSNSCTGAGNPCSRKELVESLHKLVEINEIRDGNVKLTVAFTDSSARISCYFIPHKYPGKEDYTEGVPVATFEFTRPDPNIKKWNETFREAVNRFIGEQNIYEAILLDESGRMTEGSRSNLFFVDHEGAVVTAPKSLVLPGITRKYVLEICRQQDYNIIEKALTIREAGEMAACFISGTSPKVLPVKRINDMAFSVNHPVLDMVLAGYNRLIDQQIRQ